MQALNYKKGIQLSRNVASYATAIATLDLSGKLHLQKSAHSTSMTSLSLHQLQGFPLSYLTFYRIYTSKQSQEEKHAPHMAKLPPVTGA